MTTSEGPPHTQILAVLVQVAEAEDGRYSFGRRERDIIDEVVSAAKTWLAEIVQEEFK